MGAGSSPPAQKPSAIPSHMLNGSSPLQASTSPGKSSKVRDARERESLNSSIRSSFAPRVPVGFDSVEESDAAAPTDDATPHEEAGTSLGALAIRYDILSIEYTPEYTICLMCFKWPTQPE